MRSVVRALVGGGFVLAGFGMASGCQVGFAQDAAPAPGPAVAAAAPVEPDVGEVDAPVRMHVDRQKMGVDRWENALDAKLTNLFERKASDVGSPTIMLAALWNRKFSTDTFVGLALAGLPQSHAEKKDGVKTSYTMYYGGLNLAQGLFEYKPFRVVFQVQGGQGFVYVRAKAEGLESEVHTSKFRYAEPGLALIVYEWNHLEMGLVGTSRIARVEKEDEGIENDDISSVSYGLTFRTQRW